MENGILSTLQQKIRKRRERVLKSYFKPGNQYVKSILEDIRILTSGLETKHKIKIEQTKIFKLYEDLKEYGYIGKETDIYSFGVLFGIPLNCEQVPYKPVRWLKNGQLFRYFFYWLFSENKEIMTLKAANIVAFELFCDKQKVPYRVHKPDKTRLIEPDFSILKEILKRFDGN